MKTRRQFITGLGAAWAWPIAARGQSRAPLVGILHQSDPRTIAGMVAAFQKGLSEEGFVEGRNVAIEYRWGAGDYDKMASLASELVARQPDVIFTGGPWNVRTLQMLTKIIPIVFTMGEDPVKEGIVPNLNAPGGNVTGYTFYANLLFGKCLGLLREVVPSATTLGLLLNPANPNAEQDARDAHVAAAALERRLLVFRAASEADFEPVFAAMAGAQVGATYVNIDAFFADRNKTLIASAARHAMPVMYDRRDFVVAGGLMSYGTSQPASWHQGGIYVGRILKGEKPGNLPVQQATKFDLAINLKTAKALGLAIPSGVLAIADEVIE